MLANIAQACTHPHIRRSRDAPSRHCLPIPCVVNMMTKMAALDIVDMNKHRLSLRLPTSSSSLLALPVKKHIHASFKQILHHHDACMDMKRIPTVLTSVHTYKLYAVECTHTRCRKLCAVYTHSYMYAQRTVKLLENSSTGHTQRWRFLAGTSPRPYQQVPQTHTHTRKPTHEFAHCAISPTR